MKYYLCIIMIAVLVTLTSCNNKKQSSDNSITPTAGIIRDEPSPTISSNNNTAASEIPYDIENTDPTPSDPVPAADTMSDTETLLLQNLPEIIRIVPDFMQYCENPVYLSESSRVILAAFGDLNNDENNDLAVVVEFAAEDESSWGYAQDEFNSGPRHIYILLGNSDGSFTISNKSELLILESTMGGVFGDPLENVAIEDGVLSIEHYGGSSFRWGYDMQFAYDNGQLVLKYMNVLSHSSLTANGEETICDFVNHKIERYAWSGYENINYLLYTGELSDKIYLFDNADFDEITDNANISFLPYLGYYEYDKFDKPPYLNISASQALDSIMSEYYPDFEKVYISWTKENRDNYTKLLFYEVPDYYYQGAAGILEYFKLEFYEDEGKVSGAKHCVIFRNSNYSDTEFYYIEDK